MTSIQFAPKWSRVAWLSLALATLAAPVCALAQSTNTPKYTVVDLGPVGPSWSQGQPFTVSGMGWSAARLFSPTPTTPPNGYRTRCCGKEQARRSSTSRTRRAQTALPLA